MSDKKAIECRSQSADLIGHGEKQGLIKSVFQTCFDLRGVFFALTSVMSATASNAVVFLSGQINQPVAVSFCTVATVNVLCFIFLVSVRPSIPNSKCEIFFVFIQGILWGSTMVLTPVAIILIDPGTVISILFTMPIFTLLFEIIILKEKPHKLQFCLAICVFIGVVLVSKPTCLFQRDIMTEESKQVDTLGFVFAFISAVCVSGGMICDRKHQVYSPFLIIFVSSLHGMVMCSIGCMFLHTLPLPESLHQVTLLVANGVFIFIGYALISLAIKVNTPSNVSIILSMEVPLTWISQIFFLGLPITWQPIVGASLIFISSIGVTVLKRIEESSDVINDHEDKPLIK